MPGGFYSGRELKPGRFFQARLENPFPAGQNPRHGLIIHPDSRGKVAFRATFVPLSGTFFQTITAIRFFPAYEYMPAVKPGA
jgi:hypothetical protein